VFTHPACCARPAAARDRTPALQKKTISLPMGGLAKPKRSRKSSSLSNRASGCELIGMLIAVGMLFALNSWGSRTSMRSVEEEGVSRIEIIYHIQISQV
jgi:hypothetical protein